MTRIARRQPHLVSPRSKKTGALIELVHDRTIEKPVGRFAAADADKLRGGYYTPEPVATWLSRWAIRSPSDSVLEPSCGDGNILLASALRLRELGAPKRIVSGNLVGIELSPKEAEKARVRLDASKVEPSLVQTADFFAWHNHSEARRFTACIGNPPFIRYQSFPEPSRTRAMNLMASLGLKANKLTNIWVPFVIAAVERLEPGGRLAMVIPAELLQVTYAAQLRKYLTERFRHIGLFACNELFFHGAQQEVVLVLADHALPAPKPGNDCIVALAQIGSVSELLASNPTEVLASIDQKHIKGDSEKWLKYFLTSGEITFMRELRQHAAVKELSHFARIDVGVVTGKNEFFVLNQTEAKQHNLVNLTTKLVSRAAHLRGAEITTREWRSLASADEKVFLFDSSLDKTGGLNAGAKRYIAEGEAAGFNQGYKCSIRTPWYQVPAIWTPDGFLFRQIHDFPRFVRNRAGATSTDTIHRFTSHGCDPEELIAATYTHLTAASAEIEGRSYGGGVLELEPTEAERLLIPDALGSALPLSDADSLIRRGRLDALLNENDRLVLRKKLGLSKRDCEMLKAIWIKMRDRRMVRKRKPSGAN